MPGTSLGSIQLSTLLLLLLLVPLASLELLHTIEEVSITDQQTLIHSSDVSDAVGNVPLPGSPATSRSEDHASQGSLATGDVGTYAQKSVKSTSSQKKSTLGATNTPAAPFVHPDVSHIPTSSKLATILANTRTRFNQPAMAAVVIKNGQIIDRGAVGIRKVGSPVEVTLEDIWHIGSCAKSWCGALVGLVVDQGRMNWSTTIGDVFPEWIGTMKPAYADVTVKELLEHRSGLPPNHSFHPPGTPMEQRLGYVNYALVNLSPQYVAGTQAVYSNIGITVAGTMVEKITGVSWETMITEWVAKPLGINSVGFGVAANISLSYPDQPYGHSRDGAGGYIVRTHDNPPSIGPATGIHLSADDLARWMIAHMEGERGTFDYFMSSSNWKALHTAPSGKVIHPNAEFALGWQSSERYFFHGGEVFQTTWMWADPFLKDAVVIFANSNTGASTLYALEFIQREILYAPVPLKPATIPSPAFIHPDSSSIPTSPGLDSILVNAVTGTSRPVGIAAVVIKHGRIFDRGVAGVRKAGHPELVTLDDQWMLGTWSSTFATTLVGMMVDQGKMSWSMTIGEVFPELVGIMLPDYVNITLKLLVSHRSGVPLFGNYYADATPMEQRMKWILGGLIKPILYSPNTVTSYSYLGITIAVTMVERITGVAWETMAGEWVGKPLGINSVGHGNPATYSASVPDQPWGHISDGSGGWTATTAAHPQALGPSMTMTLKADDIARFMIANAEGETAGGPFNFFMDSTMWNTLHTPYGGKTSSYQLASGFSANSHEIFFTGSDNWWSTWAWLDITGKFGVVLCANTPSGDYLNSLAGTIRAAIIDQPDPPVAPSPPVVPISPPVAPPTPPSTIPSSPSSTPPLSPPSTEPFGDPIASPVLVPEAIASPAVVPAEQPTAVPSHSPSPVEPSSPPVVLPELSPTSSACALAAKQTILWIVLSSSLSVLVALLC